MNGSVGSIGSVGLDLRTLIPFMCIAQYSEQCIEHPLIDVDYQND